jgi:hypothetical protein
VYVATENNTVYAIDAAAGTILNSVNLGTPAPSQNNACGGSGTNTGIKSTPVIDAAAGVMYVITFTNENSTPVYRIHKLTIPNLTEITNTVISASQLLSDGQTVFSFSPQNERLTAALLEANGNVYAAFGAWCDAHASVSRGMVLGWSASTLTTLPANQQPPNSSKELIDTQVSSQTPPCSTTCPKWHNYYLSSIWMSGYGIASDASGDLFFSTGNSDGVVTDNLPESAVRLSPDLTTVNDYFTPSAFATLDSKDNDLSGGGVMVVPDQPGIPPRVVAAGKGGTLYVMNRTLGQMGGYVAGGPDVPLELTIGKCECGPSYFVGSDGIGRIITSATSSSRGSLRTYKNTATFPSSFEAQYLLTPASVQSQSFFTSVSSNGTTAGTAIIWAVQRPTSKTTPNVTLYAFNAAASGGTFPLLYSSAAAGTVAGTWPNLKANANIVPVVANGKVYVASYKALTIFGPGGHLAPVKQAAPLAMTPVQVATEAAGSQIFGTITSVSDNGDQIAVQLRSGRSVSANLAYAFRNDAVAPIPFVGENVEVHGVSAPDGSFTASSVWPTKEPAMWGPDTWRPGAP